MNLFEVYPLQPVEIKRAQGSYVCDEQGRAYLDLYGGHAVISIGHQHPHFVKAIEAQLHQVAFYSNSIINPLQKRLATLLGKVSQKEDYSLFLCSSGAEANENALKLASFHNGRKKVIAFQGAFHGRTSLAVACTDNPNIQAPINQHDVVFLPFNDIQALTGAFKSYGAEICAVIIESIQGVGGIQVADLEFLRTIRRLCTDYQAIFIADEVQCGYGRSGRFYAQDYSGVEADIYTMAKGMGNGFPIGAIAIAPLFEAQYGLLGTTFGGNHLACAAAIAVLEVIANENLVENALQLGEYLMSELRQMKEITAVRGKGLMIGIELPAEYSFMRKDLLFQGGIFTGEAKPNVIRLLPALSLQKAEADRFLEIFQQTIQKVNA